MLKVTKQILDFDELHRNAWGQAIDVLDELVKLARKVNDHEKDFKN